MKTVFNKSAIALMMTAGLLASCVNDDDYKTPVLNCAETYLTSNVEPKDVPAVDLAKPYPAVEGQPSILQAYVVSSDVSGNFFKSISLQTKDGSFGFSIPVDVESVFRKMEPGRLVFVKLDSMHTDIEHGSLRIGELYNGNQVGRLAPAKFKAYVIPTCESVPENDLAQKLTLQQALNDSKINTLIDLQNVEFAKEAVYKTYFDEGNQIGGATNHWLEDATGKKVIFRTSEYATYAGDTVPKKSGTVRGVLTKYNDDYQFIVRTKADIMLDKDRFGEEPPVPGQSTTASGGTAIAFNGTLTEDFTSYTTDFSAFPKYVNDYLTGKRYWQVKEFGGNKYIEMTSFSGQGNPGANARTFLFVPVDLTAANTLTFKKKVRFMAGAALKVHYVTEAKYTAKKVIKPQDFVEITSSFTGITYPATNGSENDFSSAGTFNIPAGVTGNGFFVFEYHGPSGVTTTIQLDDIVIN